MEKKIYKVYQIKHTFLKYTATVSINKKSVECPFTGGVTGPIWTGGTFATDNQEIQTALEARPDFGNLIVLAHSSTTENENKSPESVIIEQIEKATKPAEEVEKVVIESVKNSQEAKKWLSDNIEGVTYAQMPNRDAVSDIAAAHNIEFPNWIKK